MNVDGGWVIGMDGKSILVPEFIEVLTQYDPVSGSHTGDVDARLAALESEGVSKELAFPNSVLALFGWPDREVRELCFRIYNEHIAEVQERSNNRIFGVGLINWWDADGARRTRERAEGARVEDVPHAALAGQGPGEAPDRLREHRHGRRVGGDRGGADPGLASHRREPARRRRTNSTPSASACSSRWRRSGTPSASTSSAASSTAIPGSASGGSRAGSTGCRRRIQDAEHIAASFQHLANLKVQHEPKYYWDNHMCASFMVDPLGLELVDRIGVERVMWSTDFPHNESTYGYSNESLAAVVDAVGAEAATAIVGGNIKRYLGLDD